MQVHQIEDKLIKFRLFEYLAATSDIDTTPVPGDDSFTSALVYALKALVEEKEEGRFTTVELRDKIKEKAPKFPMNQCPVLSDRVKNTSAGRIMLHPLNKPSLDAPPSPRPPLSPGLEGKTVTFLMDFSRKPSLEDIDTLGNQMNNMFEHHNLGVTRVRWGGMRHNASSHSLRVFQGILNRHRRASETKLLCEINSDDYSDRSRSRNRTLTPLDTSLPSPTTPASPSTQGLCPDREQQVDHLNLAGITFSPISPSEHDLSPR